MYSSFIYWWIWCANVFFKKFAFKYLNQIGLQNFSLCVCLLSLGTMVMLDLVECTWLMSVFPGIFCIVKYFLFDQDFGISGPQVLWGDTHLGGNCWLFIISVSFAISSFRNSICAWVHLGNFPKKLFYLDIKIYWIKWLVISYSFPSLFCNCDWV